MKRIDELFQTLDLAVHNSCSKIPICTPITGGLDSRVLTGLLLKNGFNIDLSYWIRTKANKDNEPHILKLVDIIKPTYFEIIDVEELPRDFPYAIEKLSKLYYLKNYDFVMALHMDVFAGMKKTKKQERDYFVNTWPVMEYDTQINYKKFNKIILPFNNTKVSGYMLSLSRRDRLFENLYIKMINKHFPEMAKVPRCFEKGTGRPTPINKGMLTYIKYRIVDYLRKASIHERWESFVYNARYTSPDYF